MVVFASKCLVALLALTALSCAAAAPAPATKEEYLRFYRPLDVFVADRCTYYWQSGFGPVLKARLATALAQGADKRATVKALLQEYDDTARAMCADVNAAYLAHPETLAALFRFPGLFTDIAIAGTLRSEDAARWSRDNAAFTREAAHIPGLFWLAFMLGREFLDWSATGPLPGEHEALRQVEQESRQCGAGEERKFIFGIASDKGFVSMLPARYDLVALAQEEARLRRECKRLGLAFVRQVPPASRATVAADVPADLDISSIYAQYKRKMEGGAR